MALKTQDLTMTWESKSTYIDYTYILRITENSVDRVTNTSNVTIQAILKQSYSGLMFSQWTCGVGCSINGSKIFYDQVQRRLEGTGEHLYYTWNGNLTHDSRGQLTLNVGGWFYLVEPGNSKPPPYGSESSPISMGSMVLTTIPRETTISAGRADIESALSITLDKKDSSFTHTIKYQFGSASGWVNASGNHSATAVKLSGTTHTFNLPAAFYAQIPNAQEGVGTLYCTTYSGDTQIGDVKTTQFYAVASRAKCAPTLECYVTDVNETTKSLTNSGGTTIIKGYSNARCEIQCALKNSANIDYATINGTRVTLNGSLYGYLDTTLSSGTVTFYVKDKRGYDCTAYVTREFVEYVDVACNVRPGRTNPVSGGAKLTIKGAYYSGTFGSAGVSNTLSVSYSVNNQTYSVTPTLGTNSFETTVTVPGLDYTREYSVTVTVKDKLSSLAYTTTIGKGAPVFDWGENDFAFNVDVNFNGEDSSANFNNSTTNFNSSNTSFGGSVDFKGNSVTFNTPVTFNGTVGGNIVNTTTILKAVYPVGSIYISVNTASPATLFGFGTWVQLKNRFLLGAGGDYTLNTTGGEASHTLTENEMPSHYHMGLYDTRDSGLLNWYEGSTNKMISGSNGKGAAGGPDIYTGSTGGNQAHNNMPPYLAVYMWQRTA